MAITISRRMALHMRDFRPSWTTGDPIELAEIETWLRSRGHNPIQIEATKTLGELIVDLADQEADLPPPIVGPIERAAWLAENPTFVRRVEMVMFKVAVEVQVEQSSVAYHTARSSLAYEALRDPERFGRLFASATAANFDAMRDAAFSDPANPDQANVTDGAILTAVRNLWTPFAVNGG